MNIELLTKNHLEFLCLIGGITGLSESTHVKMPHCWKSHVAAQMSYLPKYSFEGFQSQELQAFDA